MAEENKIHIYVETFTSGCDEISDVKMFSELICNKCHHMHKESNIGLTMIMTRMCIQN